MYHLIHQFPISDDVGAGQTIHNCDSRHNMILALSSILNTMEPGEKVMIELEPANEVATEIGDYEQVGLDVAEGEPVEPPKLSEEPASETAEAESGLPSYSGEDAGTNAGWP